MKRKSILYSFLLSAALGLNACTNWLDVTPNAQINKETMYETPQGFRDNLFGIYLSMTSSSLYGCDMTYGFMDELAQYYTTYQNTAHTYYEAVLYNYANKEVQKRIKNIWLGAYNSIANCNLLLENLKEKGTSFFPGNDAALIEGEVLALRAYLHFDMLRAFTPQFGAGTGQGIPYADRFTSEVFPQLTAQGTADRIMGDLGKARNLLKDIDPVLNDSYKTMSYHFDDPWDYNAPFYCYRGYRMNYYAVTALMARVYFFMGKSDLAYEFAMEVVKAAEEGRLTFTKESELSAALTTRDVVMQNEVIFALNDQTTHKTYNSFNEEGNSAFEINGLTSLYPVATDFRRLYLTMKNARSRDISLKYADVSSSKGKKIPMLRLSEMYYIACETGFAQHKDVVVPMFDKICTYRGAPTVTGNVEEADFVNRLMLEARREFLGEGQAFFWAKRLNKPVYRGNTPITLSPEQFTLPLPTAEEEFRK